MAKGTQAPYSGAVSITAQSVHRFLEMLSDEGLREEFLAEAPPQAKTVLAPEQGEHSTRSGGILGSSGGVSPRALAEGVDKLSATVKDVAGHEWKASLSVDADLMEFARGFAMKHKLTKHAIAKSLKTRSCGNGIECPPGR